MADVVNGSVPGLRRLLAEELAAWPVGSAGVVVLDGEGILASVGDPGPFPWASVTKLLSALTVLCAVQEGVLGLDDPAGPPGATVRHLLSHASGLSFEGDKVMAPPGRRRIYSNRGIELAAEHLARRTGRPFAEELTQRVLGPLGMAGTRLRGSPAHGAHGPVGDLARLGRELLEPRRLPGDLLRSATSTSFGGLSGVLPGFGRQDLNDWGLGFEIRGRKAPHWTSPDNAPTTFGHFGQSGSFLWVDPEHALACAAVGDTPFGPWAAEAWPRLSTAVLEAVAPLRRGAR